MKRRLSAILALVLVFTLCCNTASAMDTRASLTLGGYFIKMITGDTRGKVGVSYDILAAGKIADEIGIETIRIYSEDGELMVTIHGRVSNGLICRNTSNHAGDYYYTLVPGRYYAEVTVFATIGSDYDSRTITTDVVTAPS